MTRHILIPVRMFFILGCQIVPSRESQTHVLKFLARTLCLKVTTSGASRIPSWEVQCFTHLPTATFNKVYQFICFKFKAVARDRILYCTLASEARNMVPYLRPGRQNQNCLLVIRPRTIIHQGL